jgi:hypothetical protein
MREERRQRACDSSGGGQKKDYAEKLRQFAGALQMQSDDTAATTSEDR